MPAMREFLLIGAGAVLGANMRYWLTSLFTARFGTSFPYGTLVINITGSFLLGLVLVLISNRIAVDPGYRLLIGTGFLGAYTTFSAFSYDTIALLQRGDLMQATVNAVASLLGSLFAAYLGITLAQWIG